jgi:hypothetical protein
MAGRGALLLLTLVSAGLIGACGWLVYERTRAYDVGIAAGDAKGESFVLMKALQTVTGRYYPRIRIAIHSTGGTADSLKQMDQGWAQFAAVQSDVPAGPATRSVAVLFQDYFQLLVHTRQEATTVKKEGAPDSTPAITHFAGVKGEKIALPKSGGQYNSFMALAHHFGLRQSDFVLVGGDDEAAERAFTKGEADAIFKVRALHNTGLETLLKSDGVALVPIEDAAAMQMESPSYMPASIPKGAYFGNPAIPPIDVPTIALQRLLVARRDVDDDVVYAITQVLMERRQELAAAISNADEAVRPLVAHSAQPVVRAGLHPGALAYYEQDKSSFIGSHADSIGLGVCAFVLAGLWVFEWRRSVTLRQKNHADDLNVKIMGLMRNAKEITSGQETADFRTELMSILEQAIADLDANRLSDRSFLLFHAVWQVAIDEIRDHETAAGVRRGPRVEGGATGELSAHSTLARYLQPRAS